MPIHIKEIFIKNFKRFNGDFWLSLNSNLNILVGDNEAGKSTIMEAINLALTGTLGGKYLRNELSQHIFNNNVVSSYLDSISAGTAIALPEIIIELYFGGDEYALFKGNGNSKHANESGIRLKIAFDEKYQDEYEELIRQGNIKTLPIEYYDVFCYSFAREAITPKSIPVKPAFIDSSNTKYQNGSDVYITKIIRDLLESSDLVNVAQAYRTAREKFAENPAIANINTKVQIASKISDKNIKIDIDLPSKNAWEMAVMTYLDEVPFHLIGKGEQCIAKTKLALGHRKTKEANILLIEEPENHLSHTRLNSLIKDIETDGVGKQIIITTHSSFVANKLGLDKIIVLNNGNSLSLSDLSMGTNTFFSKLAGYDTLRLVLCKKAILVEGDSDELIIQRAYMDEHSGKLPIEDSIDVISVGTSFLRFLEIAKKIEKPTVVVTDNDGDLAALNLKYDSYIGTNQSDFIKICFDPVVSTGSMNDFNYNTLEPTLLRANSLSKFNTIFNQSFTSEDLLLKYMRSNKTKCALAIFELSTNIQYPEYIKDAIAD